MKYQELLELFSVKYGMSIEKDDNGYIVNNLFYIHPEDNFEMRRSVGRSIRLDFVEWVVSGTTTTPATLWEPEDHDYYEISRDRTLAKAFAQVLLIELEDDISNSVEGLSIPQDL